MPSAGQILTADMLQPDAWTDWAAEGISYDNITIGNGAVYAAYTHVGALVICRWFLQFGSTTSFSSTPGIVLPAAPVGSYVQHCALGTMSFYDNSAGSGTRQGGTLVINFGSHAFFLDDSAAGSTVNATTPFTWSTNDRISFIATYEAS